MYVTETVSKQIREMYCKLTLPVQYSPNSQSSTRASLDDMFVELHLQKFDTGKLPETLAYRDVEEIQQRMQSTSDAIQIPQLFDVLHDRIAPHNVLIRGKAGVGKTTLIKQMAKQWAERKLWTGLKYLFVVTLRELLQDRKWTLEDLLLGELTLSEEEKAVILKKIHGNPEFTMVVFEGLDEIPEFQFSKRRRFSYCEKVELNTLISSIIDNVMLPGAKIIITSRPTDQLPSSVCDRVTEMYGFSKESIEEYVDKFSGHNSEMQRFIKSYLHTNVNIATFCYIPIQCNFVCICLADIHSSGLAGNMAVVNTITQLYIYATMHLVRKLHPALKNDATHIDSKTIFNKFGVSLKKHAEVAKRCTLSSPLRLILYGEDLDEISAEDRHSGYLAESLTTDAVTRGLKRQCWSFSHLTIQEFFAAVGLLRGRSIRILQLIKSKTSVRQHEVLLTFIVGLLGDPNNANFMKCLGSEDNQMMPLAYKQLNPQTFIRKLSPKIDPLKLVTLVHETQLQDLVDIVPDVIESDQVFPTEMMSLTWVLKQQKCCILKLK